jgi:hypothetical protein
MWKRLLLEVVSRMGLRMDTGRINGLDTNLACLAGFLCILVILSKIYVRHFLLAVLTAPATIFLRRNHHGRKNVQ